MYIENMVKQILKPQRGDMSIAMPSPHTPKAPEGRYVGIRAIITKV